jgi:hypothetical protein
MWIEPCCNALAGTRLLRETHVRLTPCQHPALTGSGLTRRRIGPMPTARPLCESSYAVPRASATSACTAAANVMTLVSMRSAGAGGDS